MEESRWLFHLPEEMFETPVFLTKEDESGSSMHVDNEETELRRIVRWLQ